MRMVLVTEVYILCIVIVAAILGGVVGWEREKANKPAGLRTHIIICASAALLTKLGMIIIDQFEILYGPAIQTDPLRILNALIVGVSFIGGGLIIKDQESLTVRNLTTAASLVMVASIGMTVALEQYVLAVGVTVLILVVSSIVVPTKKKKRVAKR